VISTSNITIQFGSKPLFENISVKFTPGNRYGLIGANGCGKSTFMKILAGDLAATNGNVAIEDGLRVGKLSQDQFAFEKFSVLDTVIMGHAKLWAVKQERDNIYMQEEMTDADGMRAGELEEEFAHLGGYEAESSAGELLMSVGIELAQHDGLMSTVAPGFKLRVLLVQALFSDPDIMLLDEPTNNLDINTIRWLEEILLKRKCTMIIISHDRHFLNRICTHMADLDYGELRVYPGNYDEYMTAATLVRDQLLNSNAKKKAQIDELQAFVSRFSANASKAKQATSRARQIDKIKLDEVKVSSRMSPYIKFEQQKQLYRMAFEVNNLCKSYDDLQLLKGFNFNVQVGERIAIIGENGIGKTTLMRCLVGETDTDAGEVKFSENATLGYCAQDHTSDFSQEMTLIEWMTQWRQETDDEQAVRGILGKLLFSRDQVNKSVKQLSGGEQGRMLFGKLMLQQSNIMFLDEPTNHLDMESIEAINLALENYAGTLIFVSHDREFVSSLATRVIEIKTDGIVDRMGSYDDYLHSQGIEVQSH
jgi:ATPase subunit of ABC transporter with duplicated ATPase domains